MVEMRVRIGTHSVLSPKSWKFIQHKREQQTFPTFIQHIHSSSK